jgi:hypothetical protein
MSEIKDKLCWHFNGERMISESDHLAAINQAKIDAVREFAGWCENQFILDDVDANTAAQIFIEQLKEQGND